MNVVEVQPQRMIAASQYGMLTTLQDVSEPNNDDNLVEEAW